MNLPTLSVIVTNFNGGDEPLDFLASVEKSDYPPGRRETIVVDSGSTDGSPDAIARAFPSARLVRLPEARGLPHAVNQGLAVASGQYVFLGNDDLTVDRSSLRLLVETMERDRGVGISSGTVFLKYPKPGEADVAATDYSFHPLLGRITTHRRRSSADVAWLPSCALMIRRRVLDTVGGFDERFAPIYFDDLDFCDRTRRAGFRIQTVPAAVFRHGGSQSMGKNLTGKTRAWYRNKLRYILKREPFGTALAALLLQAFTSPVLLLPKRPAATHLQSGGFRAFWRGVAWNLVKLPETLAARGRVKEPVR
jgi:GT2 family glycosyltransferase